MPFKLTKLVGFLLPDKEEVERFINRDIHKTISDDFK